VSGVKIIIRNNDGDLVQLANFIDRTGWEVTQNAEEGSVGISTLYLDDLDQSVWDTLGYNDGGRRQIRLVDYDSNKIVHFGYTARRAIRRRFDVYGNDLGRAWSIEIWDPNSYLQRRILTHHGAKRPRETDVERIQWLITAHEWDIIDQFKISTGSTKTMSKADYRGQTVGDVVADCAQQARKNYWVDILDDGAGDRLTFWYARDSVADYVSTLSISNDLADLSVSALSAGTATLVYPPSNETEYQMDPSRIFTGIYGTWEKGAVYRHSITGDTQFERWDTAMQWPNIHEKDRAIERAENMLERLADEDERIETHIIVPSTQAHLVRAGMRIPLKLTHIPRLTSYTDCRILSRGLAPIGDGTRYRIPLVLEPIAASAAALSCSTSIAALVNAELGDQPNGGGIVSISLTPTQGEDSIILYTALALHPSGVDDTNMHATGGGTTMFTSDHTGGHPTAANMYKAVAAASGSSTVTAAYTVGGSNSEWAAIAVAIQTTATSPVQNVSVDGTGPTTVTIATPTSGHLLVLQATVRDDPTITNVTPGTGFWTKQAEASAAVGISEDVCAIFTHCCDGTETTGPYGVSGGGNVTVSEWVIS